MIISRSNTDRIRFQLGAVPGYRFDANWGELWAVYLPASHCAWLAHVMLQGILGCTRVRSKRNTSSSAPSSGCHNGVWTAARERVRECFALKQADNSASFPPKNFPGSRVCDECVIASTRGWGYGETEREIYCNGVTWMEEDKRCWDSGLKRLGLCVTVTYASLKCVTDSLRNHSILNIIREGNGS